MLNVCQDDVITVKFTNYMEDQSMAGIP